MEGGFLFLDYELAREIEPNSKLTSATTSKYNSSSYATRIPSAIIQNRATGKIELVDEAADKIRLQKMQQDLDSLEVNLATGNEKIVRGEIAEEPAESYLKSIDQIKKYIVEGDLFQANLSRQWQAKLDKGASPHIIYQKLRESNPAPFAGLALYNGTAIISSSPERLVRVKNRVAESRPIAGTHPRSADKREDRELANRLLAHPKEQAEHIMLIDLVRNDLGRVCKTGTVEVNEKMGLESYTHVHHIVSNIRGELRDEVTPAEVIRALFPGGTITGCPKVRCMEIIAELEQQPRGAYTGSFGYLNHNGDMDLNILIRTLTMSLSTVAPSTITLRAGAGIVYDSIPEKELAESRAKAKGVLLALKSISLQEVVW